MTAHANADNKALSGLGFLSRIARNKNLGRILAISLAAAAVVSGAATYATLAGSKSFDDSPAIVLLLLNIDLVLSLLLAFLIARRIVAVWSERRKGSAGSRLHVKLVVWFGLVSVVPAIVVGVFSVSFFNFGVESWFSERVRTALSESRSAAEIYLKEHKRNIRADATAMANDLNRDAIIALQINPKRLNDAIKIQATIRELNEALVFDGTGKILARAGLTYLLEFETVPPVAMEQARRGEIALMTSENDDRVRALVRLASPSEIFLYVGRLVDPIVLSHMKRSEGAVEEFEQLEIKRSDIQINFALIFVVVGLLLLLAAVWVGLMFATQLSDPISSLIAATEKVRSGNLSARVPEDTPEDEVGSLSRAFNRMTSELESNRGELMEANLQLDERRRFTETVLEGVSAGVVGLDKDGTINLPNRSASDLLGVELDEVIGQRMADVVVELAPLIDSAARSRSRKPTEGEIRITRNNEAHTLLVRIGSEWSEGKITGFVITFDDVSQLLAAQRKAAWADVARRIAHEIKNPLTPIQLSAERLRRKYINEIGSDTEVFETCTDTIIRHVEDIGRMVDEFSNFARLPVPQMRAEDLNDLCRQVLFLYRNGQPHIDFEADLSPEAYSLVCDGRQFSQALTNLFKNAVESIEGRNGSAEKGCITLSSSYEEDFVDVIVTDNGLGLPKENREQLTDPYFTTRKSGTGLGLAIVRKIMEDHGGGVDLRDGPGGGAVARLRMSRHMAASQAEDVETANTREQANGI